MNSAPETLDTLQELARALNNDPNFATTMLNLLAGKVNKNGDTITGALRAQKFITTDGYRCSGVDGLFFETYGGGFFMSDSEWVRTAGRKGIYTGGKMKADGGFEGTATNASKLGNMTLTDLLAEVDRRIAAKHP